MTQQERVATFIQEHDMQAPPEYRLLDAVSELGEVAKEAAESTSYGDSPAELDIASDEIGDVLFAVLALASATDIDASDALDEALEKYERRLEASGSAASGN